jgi:hypothetical protein
MGMYPYFEVVFLVCAFAASLTLQFMLYAAMLWMAKLPIAMFLCAVSDMPFERAIQWILWPLRPRSSFIQ